MFRHFIAPVVVFADPTGPMMKLMGALECSQPAAFGPGGVKVWNSPAVSLIARTPDPGPKSQSFAIFDFVRCKSGQTPTP